MKFVDCDLGMHHLALKSKTDIGSTSIYLNIEESSFPRKNIKNYCGNTQEFAYLSTVTLEFNIS